MKINERKIRQFIRESLLKEAPGRPGIGTPDSRTSRRQQSDLNVAKTRNKKGIAALSKLASNLLRNKDYKGTEGDLATFLGILNGMKSKSDAEIKKYAQALQSVPSDNFEIGDFSAFMDNDLIRRAYKKYNKGSKSPSPRKKEGERKKKKKTKSKNADILKIQELLNQFGKAGQDYEGKDIERDGNWGARTRSAYSQVLKSINDLSEKDDNLMTEMGLKDLLDDPLFKKLNKEKKGGSGSWSTLSKKLYPEGRSTGPAYKEAIVILQKYLESDKKYNMADNIKKKKEDDEKQKKKEEQERPRTLLDFVKNIDDAQKMVEDNCIGKKYKSSVYTSAAEDIEHIKQNKSATGLVINDVIGLGRPTGRPVPLLYFYSASKYPRPNIIQKAKEWVGLKGKKAISAKGNNAFREKDFGSEGTMHAYMDWFDNKYGKAKSTSSDNTFLFLFEKGGTVYAGIDSTNYSIMFGGGLYVYEIDQKLTSNGEIKFKNELVGIMNAITPMNPN